MIFNQKKLEIAKLILKMIDRDNNGVGYSIVDLNRRDQEFTKQVFLGYHIVDTWEGTPYVWGEHGYIYDEDECE